MLYYIYINNEGRPFLSDEELEGFILWEITIDKQLALRIISGLEDILNSKEEIKG